VTAETSCRKGATSHWTVARSAPSAARRLGSATVSRLNSKCQNQTSQIEAVSEKPLDGQSVVDASGLVVAPGFVDWRVHGRSVLSHRVLAFDGVTTSLELEMGILPLNSGHHRSGVVFGGAGPSQWRQGPNGIWRFHRHEVARPAGGASRRGGVGRSTGARATDQGWRTTLALTRRASAWPFASPTWSRPRPLRSSRGSMRATRARSPSLRHGHAARAWILNDPLARKETTAAHDRGIDLFVPIPAIHAPVRVNDPG
jgi:hypothetical protein